MDSFQLSDDKFGDDLLDTSMNFNDMSLHSGSFEGDSTLDTPQANLLKPGTSTNKPRFSLFAAPSQSSQDSTSTHHKHPAASQSSYQFEGESFDAGGEAELSYTEETERHDEQQHQQQHQQQHSDSQLHDDDEEGGSILTMAELRHDPSRPVPSSPGRDARLQTQLQELQAMNAVFDKYAEALESARGHNERLANQALQTSLLLNQYINILNQTAHTSNLVLHPGWEGSKDDEEKLIQEQLRQQREEEERVAAAEAQAEAARREKERQAAERAAATSSRGGVSAGRGGSVRGGSVTRGRVVSGSRGGANSLGKETGIPAPRPTSAAGGRANYSSVKSSGYGPTKRT